MMFDPTFRRRRDFLLKVLALPAAAAVAIPLLTDDADAQQDPGIPGKGPGGKAGKGQGPGGKGQGPFGKGKKGKGKGPDGGKGKGKNPDRPGPPQ
jgi:hypothetical protein